MTVHTRRGFGSRFDATDRQRPADSWLAVANKNRNRRACLKPCLTLADVRYSSIVRRNLVVFVTVCSLLWAVTGVSVVVIAYHEHHHHAKDHDHVKAIEVVFHGHDHESSPTHDHELTAPMSASRTSWSGLMHSMASRVNDFVDADVELFRDAAGASTETRDPRPPAFLLHCVLLT